MDSIWFLMVSILRRSKNDDDDDDGGGSGNDDYDGVPLMELMRTMTAYILCTDWASIYWEVGSSNLN